MLSNTQKIKIINYLYEVSSSGNTTGPKGRNAYINKDFSLDQWISIVTKKMTKLLNLDDSKVIPLKEFILKCEIKRIINEEINSFLMNKSIIF